MNSKANSFDSTVITINNTNSRVTDNYDFEFQLKSSVTLENTEVCLVKAILYNSIFNVVKSAFNNSTYTYSYPVGNVLTYNFPIDMPDGSYSIESLNGYLQDQMVNNNTYLIDNTGEKVFYLKFNVNLIYYG